MTIDRYLIREIVRPMVLGVGLLMFVFAGFSSARELMAVAEGAIDLTSALKLIGLNTLTTLDILLPSALFFSVLAGLGRLHRDGEILVLAAAGVSPWRTLWSVCQFSIAVAVIVSLMSLEGRPWVYRKIYQLEAQAAEKFDLKQMSAGTFVRLEDSDYVFIADGLDRSNGLYRDIFMHRDYDQGESQEVIFAHGAQLPNIKSGEPGTVDFFKGHLYLLDNQGTQDLTMKYDNFSVILPMAEKKRDKFRRKAARTESLKASAELKDVAEYQWRQSIPVMAILLALIAVPLSRAGMRQQRSRNTVVAIGVYILVFSFTTAIRTWVQQGKLPPVPGLWVSHLLPILLLVALLRPDKRFQF